MRLVPILALGAPLVLLVCGCASARYVYKSGEYGVIAIPHNVQLHRERAEALMASHFPEGYEVVEEQEVPVGTLVQSSDEVRMVSGVMVAPDRQGGLALHFDASSAAAGELDVTTVPPTSIPREWRIVYRSAGRPDIAPAVAERETRE